MHHTNVNRKKKSKSTEPNKMVRMNISLGKPYSVIIEKAIAMGWATSRSEAIRQALREYGRKLDEDEYQLVKKASDKITEKVDSGEMKTHTLDEIKKRYNAE